MHNSNSGSSHFMSNYIGFRLSNIVFDSKSFPPRLPCVWIDFTNMLHMQHELDQLSSPGEKFASAVKPTNQVWESQLSWNNTRLYWLNPCRLHHCNINITVKCYVTKSFTSIPWQTNPIGIACQSLNLSSTNYYWKQFQLQRHYSNSGLGSKLSAISRSFSCIRIKLSWNTFTGEWATILRGKIDLTAAITAAEWLKQQQYTYILVRVGSRGVSGQVVIWQYMYSQSRLLARRLIANIGL